MPANDRVPDRAFAVLVPALIIETGVLQAPRLTIGLSGAWSWVTTLLASALLIANVALVVAVVRRNGFADYRDLLTGLLGHWPGRLLLLLHGAALTLRAARMLRTTMELVTEELLVHTPHWAVAAAGMLLIGAMTRHGFEPLARFTAVVFPFYYPALVTGLLIGLLQGQPSSLLDFTGLAPARLLADALVLLTQLQGYTVLLVLLPRARPARGVLAPALVGAGMIALGATLLMAATVSALGETAAELTWPTLDVIEVAGAPGLVVERADLVFFGVWLFAMVTSTAWNLYGVAYMLGGALAPRTAMTWWAPVTAALVMLVALAPQPFAWAEALFERGAVSTGAVETALPAALWTASWLRGRLMRA